MGQAGGTTRGAGGFGKSGEVECLIGLRARGGPERGGGGRERRSGGKTGFLILCTCRSRRSTADDRLLCFFGGALVFSFGCASSQSGVTFNIYKYVFAKFAKRGWTPPCMT